MEAVYIDKNKALVEQCMQGKRQAQSQLYQLYAKAMYNVALRILNDEDEAKDVLQEAFVDAFTRITSFRQETTFGLWLKQIVVNRSINWLRKRKVELLSLDEVEEDIVHLESENDDDITYKVEHIRECIFNMNDTDRIILSLYLLEGYDHEEIAHILNIKETNSRIQLMRAKRKLLEMLKRKGIVE